MKRKLLITVLCLALLAVLAGARYSLFSTVWGFNTATLHCEIDGKSIETVISDEDWDAIASAVNFKLMEENTYRCPVDEKLYISVDFGADLYIAQDGCSLIGISDGGKCVSLDSEEALTVKKILLKYGVEL